MKIRLAFQLLFSSQPLVATLGLFRFSFPALFGTQLFVIFLFVVLVVLVAAVVAGKQTSRKTQWRWRANQPIVRHE
jgi:hypothetical protein